MGSVFCCSFCVVGFEMIMGKVLVMGPRVSEELKRGGGQKTVAFNGVLVYVVVVPK